MGCVFVPAPRSSNRVGDNVERRVESGVGIKRQSNAKRGGGLLFVVVSGRWHTTQGVGRGANDDDGDHDCDDPRTTTTMRRWWWRRRPRQHHRSTSSSRPSIPCKTGIASSRRRCSICTCDTSIRRWSRCSSHSSFVVDARWSGIAVK